MFKALDGKDNLVSANKINKSNIINTNFRCPCCNEEVHYVKESIDFKRAHFAHNSKKLNKCDAVYDKDYKTEWHINMQNIFNENLQEIIVDVNGKRKIADIKDKNKIIEFQHSPIKPEDFVERTKLYSKNNILIWVFDMRGKINKKNCYWLKRKSDTKKFVTIQKPIDINNEFLLCFRNLNIGEEDNLICYFYLIFQINDNDFLLVNFCNGKGYYNGKILKYNQFKNFITNEELHFESQRYIDKNEICVDHKFKIDVSRKPTRIDIYKCYDVDFESKCEICKCLRKYKVKEAHYNMIEEKEEPTCIKEGKIYKHCYYCGKKETVQKLKIDKNNHKFTENPKMIARSTCIKKGIQEKECEYCGYKIKEELSLSLWHNYNNYEIIEDSTCTKSGLERRICKDCGKIDDSVIPVKRHAFVQYEKESTCQEKGCIYEKCKVCGKIEIIDYLPKEHNYKTEYFYDEQLCCEDVCKTCGTKTNTYYHHYKNNVCTRCGMPK